MARFDKRKIYPDPSVDSVLNAVKALVPRRVNGVIKQPGPKDLFVPINIAVTRIEDRTQWLIPAIKMNEGGTSPFFGSLRGQFAEPTGNAIDIIKAEGSQHPDTAIAQINDFDSLREGDIVSMDIFDDTTFSAVALTFQYALSANNVGNWTSFIVAYDNSLAASAIGATVLIEANTIEIGTLIYYAEAPNTFVGLANADIIIA